MTTIKYLICLAHYIKPVRKRCKNKLQSIKCMCERNLSNKYYKTENRTLMVWTRVK